jgi:hypothetical protein
MRSSILIGAALAMGIAMPAQAQDKKETTGQRAGDIATQPARDIGAVKTKVPPVLQRAVANPMPACPSAPPSGPP